MVGVEAAVGEAKAAMVMVAMVVAEGSVGAVEARAVAGYSPPAKQVE